ncbi:hypothetical protein EOA27_01205 [Mesorhizobium sp. M2A.F.Ca.ET.037.01.1.1]|uniref:hypothetical protein n=1 Tax=unclassified Mesorhizobium TaxID=325217 RepID=UPI000F75F0C6|nr:MULTISPECIES: hypothetical protein [unclassified Mesorhizobium]RUY13057.1 hypothetical protein EOA25_01610 [Mesorhizobium sp. M2A.F.Ca.ET.040.01.1.1]RVC68838.1 hypothetical protein EN759_10255 [Mesorhizobium sp. M00.F.Ca.ET.038.03.1.1]RVC72180.1 hypothetical protein EN766_24475 [Mesorhizobium sp. M2A.F.Ca.ET.046.02.1.1]AZO04532.1 hypothetical protein EJ068_16730 [Mesorhizobium sp. M2A.F.Ca.ET.043.02.1.1]AZO35276.1 hypothetical protein EJ072_12965 [Mesorhizobium sp. M2A.F.Ca.ET.046.03.2.1]
MKRQFACVAALAIGLGASPASADPFSDLAALPTFYTDATMKTMKPMTGFKKAWFAMPKHDRVKMTKACNDPVMSGHHAQFCANALALGGDN